MNTKQVILSIVMIMVGVRSVSAADCDVAGTLTLQCNDVQVTEGTLTQTQCQNAGCTYYAIGDGVCRCSYPVSCSGQNTCCDPDGSWGGTAWRYYHSPYVTCRAYVIGGTGGIVGTEGTCNWQSTDCSAGDRCGTTTSEKIYAGLCTTEPAACATGGWYKTCCITDGNGNLTGAPGTCAGAGGCSVGTCVREQGCDSSKRLGTNYYNCYYLEGQPTPTPTGGTSGCPGTCCPDGCSADTVPPTAGDSWCAERGLNTCCSRCNSQTQYPSYGSVLVMIYEDTNGDGDFDKGVDRGVNYTRVPGISIGFQIT